MPLIPSKLRFGSVAFDIWQLSDGRFAFDYQQGSKRFIVKRKKFEDLRKEAERISTNLLNGENESLNLDAQTRRICVAAIDYLAPTGLQLDAIAREAAEAHRMTGGRSIIELARFYVGRNPTLQTAPKTAEIVRKLIASLRENTRSGKYVDDLERDLGKFAGQFPDIDLCNIDGLQEYLQQLRNRDGNAVGTRRRDNVRDAIVRLFHFAQERGFLAEDRKTAADYLHRIDAGTDVSTFTPEEMSLLLENVTYEWRPWMAIAAFAGLRTSEIFRLEWNAIKWDHNVIAVARRVAKKVRISRKVPMSENLIAWLAPWREKMGNIYSLTPTWEALENRHGTEIERLEKKTGIKWSTNALRHSFGSYRLAILKSEAQVAFEMGNSPAKVRENYHDPKSESEARKYFSLMPPEAVDNVIPLPLQFR